MGNSWYLISFFFNNDTISDQFVSVHDQFFFFFVKGSNNNLSAFDTKPKYHQKTKSILKPKINYKKKLGNDMWFT